ncbi:MAG: uroporphyrinogen decarboxylase family protein [bacterium]
MSRKEIVHRAIEFAGAERVPIHYCNRDFDSSDTVACEYGRAADFVPAEPGMSEWGYVWEVLDKTMGQPRTHPLTGRDSLVCYVPPDPKACGRLDEVDRVLSDKDDRFVKFGLGITGFNQATFLRGFEDFLADLYMDREFVEEILDIVFGFENSIIEQAVQRPVDAVVFADDWGTQQGLIIAPDLWREVFRPRYADQFAQVHNAGKKVWFHSCGHVYSIIQDLIDIGVDVLEFLQPDLLGVDRLAEEFGGKVCFCCSIDHQRRAISGTRDEIFAYAQYLRDKLGTSNGGFIAYIEDYACLGMSEQNYQWIREAFHSLNLNTPTQTPIPPMSPLPLGEG